MKKSTLAVALLSFCTLSLSALSVSALGTMPKAATESEAVSPGTYQALDLNRDGWIGYDEAQSHPTLAAQYANYDRDGNGYLSPSEFSAFEQKELGMAVVPPYGATMTFEELDANKDGRLAREETIHEPGLHQQYSSVDQDRDTYISRSEFSAFETGALGAMPGTSGPAPARKLSFEELDTNADGTITRQEYEAVMAMETPSQEISLSSMDVNRDGVVDKREASADPTLQEQFDSFDTDQNSLIDQSEFSVFESMYENIREGVTR